MVGAMTSSLPGATSVPAGPGWPTCSFGAAPGRCGPAFTGRRRRRACPSALLVFCPRPAPTTVGHRVREGRRRRAGGERHHACTRWPEAALADATAAVEWAADHAAELDADPGRLLVGGEGTGAWLATAVALEARDDRLAERGPSAPGGGGGVGHRGGCGRVGPSRRGGRRWPVSPRRSWSRSATVRTCSMHAAHVQRLPERRDPRRRLHDDGPVAGVADCLAPTLRRALGGGTRAAGMTPTATTTTALGPAASVGRRGVAGRDSGDLARRLEHHRGELTAFCAVRLRSREEAEDAVQETLHPGMAAATTAFGACPRCGRGCTASPETCASTC